jgi:hypothetical protein
MRFRLVIDRGQPVSPWFHCMKRVRHGKYNTPADGQRLRDM